MAAYLNPKDTEFDANGWSSDGWTTPKASESNTRKNAPVSTTNDIEDWGGDASGDFAVRPTETGFGRRDDDDDDGESLKDDTCRNCGQAGHFARECSEPKKLSAACFNCGEAGHNKVDCPQPHVFKGECRLCGEEGHPGSECPDRVCQFCGEKGHHAGQCEGIRRDVFEGAAEDLGMDLAWERLLSLDAGNDIEFREVLLAYAKTALDAGFPIELQDIENGLRQHDRPFHLIAMNFQPSDRQTLVGMDGRPGKEYLLKISTSSKARREFEKQDWPEDANQNLERLANCGIKMWNGQVICEFCKEPGHTGKRCPDEMAREMIQARNVRKCVHCDQEGHVARDCPGVAESTTDRRRVGQCRTCKKYHPRGQCQERRPREDVECRKCGEVGHMARDCPNAPTQSSSECHNCGQAGHMAKECPNERVIKCRNCDEFGHGSRECPKPRDYTRVKCRNCGEMGHTIARCKKEATETPDTIRGGDSWGTAGEASGFEDSNAAANSGNDGWGTVDTTASAW